MKTCDLAQTAMADIASNAVDTVKDTVKGVAKSVDPKQGEAAPMHGKTAVVTGANDSHCRCNGNKLSIG